MRKLLFIALIISTASLAQAQDAQNSSKSVQLKVNTTTTYATKQKGKNTRRNFCNEKLEG
jgi:hypothetical protein